MIDFHSHVIPETIIAAMRADPERYATRIDAQAEEVRKGFANEGVAIGEIRNSVRTLGERENESDGENLRHAQTLLSNRVPQSGRFHAGGRIRCK